MSDPSKPDQPALPADSPADPSVAQPKTWKVGTLTYTKFGLVTIFIWTLWGDLVQTLTANVFPVSMPLQLERLHIPQWYIPILMGVLGQCVFLPLNPYFSFRSDRYRSRWGRRIPYIFKSLFPVAICFAILGFSDEIGEYIRNAEWITHLGLGPTLPIVLVMGFFILAFDFANIFINTIYWYLFADVIPPELMGRFFALFRVVGMVAGSFFGIFVQRYIETETKYIYLGAAALYVIGFGLMCWKVKEGQYPPPSDLGPREAWYIRLGRMFKVYVKECFRHPVHISLYATSSFIAVSQAALFGSMFFYRQYLHISQASLGDFGAALSCSTIILAFPLGWIVDKIHPMRASLIGLGGGIIFSFFGLYMDSFLFYCIFMLVRTPFGQLLEAATIPLYVRVFPRKQYGQFGSANGMVRSFTMIIASFAAGWFINFFVSRMGVRGDAYGFLWMAVFQTIAFAFMLLMYLYWKKNGAQKFSYDPEQVLAADEAAAAAAEPALVTAGDSAGEQK